MASVWDMTLKTQVRKTKRDFRITSNQKHLHNNREKRQPTERETTLANHTSGKGLNPSS